MFKEVLDMLPPDSTGTVVTTVVAVGIGIGALTALLGALHSRVTMALLMCALGSLLGATLPSRLSLGINTPVAICVMAIALGLVGFLLHRICVALCLGMVFAIVAMMVMYDQTTPVTYPPLVDIPLKATMGETVGNAWHNATPLFRSTSLWISSVVFVVLSIMGFFFPKFGMAALYSMTGTILLLFAIALGHNSPSIHWLDSLRSGPMTTAALGFTVLLLGFVSQIVLLYRQGKPSEDASFAALA